MIQDDGIVCTGAGMFSKQPLHLTVKATRERFETAFNQAVEQFHEETSDGLVEIELYPTD